MLNFHNCSGGLVRELCVVNDRACFRRTSIPDFKRAREILATLKWWDSERCVANGMLSVSFNRVWFHIGNWGKPQHMAAMWLYIPSAMELDCFNILGGYSGTHGIHLSLVWCLIPLCMVNYLSECFNLKVSQWDFLNYSWKLWPVQLSLSANVLSNLDLRVLSH